MSELGTKEVYFPWDNPFMEYFSEYKKDHVELSIMKKKTIEIKYDDFSKELQETYNNVTDPLKSILTALQDCYKERAGEVAYNTAIKNNCFKIKVIKDDDETPITIDGKSYEILKNEDKENIDIIADNLIRKYQFITIRETKEILLFNGKIYDKEEAESIIKEETEKQIENCREYQRTEVINKIKSKTYRGMKSFDRDPRLITIDNGILNIITGELKEHTAKHYSRILIPVTYTEPEFEDIEDNLDDTMFLKFLKNSFTVDGKFNKEDFETVIEVMASFLIRQNIDQKAFMFLGHGENGKSVLMGVIQTILGTNNVTNTPLQKLVHDQFMMERLNGKLANIFSDIESDELFKTGELKSLVCDESITVQQKHQKAYDMQPLVKLLFSCNLFPKTKDQTHGFFRRWIIVEWLRNFENDPDKIDDLKNKICNNQEEINKIFSSLIPIARMLWNNQKFTHTKPEKEVKKMWLENSNPLESWIRQYTKESENSTPLRETHDFYKQTMFDKGETPVTMHKLNLALEEEYEKTKSNGVRVWLNMELIKSIQTKLKDNDDSDSTEEHDDSGKCTWNHGKCQIPRNHEHIE